MSEDEAILLLLDLGTGAGRRSDRIGDMVTELQKSAGINESTAKDIYYNLKRTDSVQLGNMKL